MGTSQSSCGSPSGVPMVPPWVPDIPLPPTSTEGAPPDAVPEPDAATTPAQLPDEPWQPIPIAPARRFLGANRNLVDYARCGVGASMRRGLWQYNKKKKNKSTTAT